MSSLRSTRSRKIINENVEIKEKITDKNSHKQVKAKTTRSGTASRQTLKEITHKEEGTQQTNKGRKSTKTKMVRDEEGNENATEQQVETIENNEIITTADRNEQDNPKEEDEAMEVTEEIKKETDEDCSPVKKLKLSEVTENLKEADGAVEQPEKVDNEIVKTAEPKANDTDTETVSAPTESVNNAESVTKAETNVPADLAANESNPTNITTANNEDKSQTTIPKNRSFSLKSQTTSNKSTENSATTTTSNLPKQLLTVISNLYLNVGERLHLDFPPRCLEDLAYCHQNHYRSDLPEAPIPSQAHSLRSALQHYRYVSFINSTTDMCHRGEFPGKGVFTKIIELVLSINYVTKQPNLNIAIYQQSYHKSIELFSMIVRTFPPCWHKMRPYYVGFLEYGLDLAKLKTNKEEALSKSSKIFDILLDLLEDVLKNATPEDLTTLKSETLKLQGSNLDVTSPTNNTELSMCSEYWNQNEYEERERQKQTFDALPLDQKLERAFMALRLLLQILENDLAMWMLHHNKKTKEWIFCSENRPLIVVLCEFTQYTRMTRVARRIFTVYSEAAAKGLCKKRLQVLERYISLLMVASNTADMENTAIGVKYPFLGEQTKTLIHEFFKIFKAHNREEISKYMETIEILRIPYVRYEFIDNVLIMFQFTNSEPLTPQKIAIDVAKKRWLKYKPTAELSNPDEYISREQYLHLLLDALRNYCAYHGSKTFLHVTTDATQIFHLTTTNDSVHRWPTHGSGVLVLKKMAKDIEKLEGQLKMTVRMSKPKVDLPLADIYIDEAIILKYRTDLKFVISLRNVILKQKEAYGDVDFSQWLEFLNDFCPKNIVKEEAN